jgi:predicted nucleic acid-binding protein
VGSLILPASGSVYIDTQILIYTVERYSRYVSHLTLSWTAAKAGRIEVVTTELAVLETLVVPMRTKNRAVQQDYETALFRRSLRLVPISRPILYEAARLRAVHPQLKTPDAVHATTANLGGASLLLTNDRAFRSLTSLKMPVTILDEVTP